MVLKMCQHKMQKDGGSQTTNTIVGTSRNIKRIGISFETKLANDKVKVPVDFINQLGTFEYL